MAEPSGPQWCARFPGSASTSDLSPEFRPGAEAFIAALKVSGASVTISATFRPPERAYLMHFCCLVAGYRDKAGIFHQIAPEAVPPFKGVDIDWTHGGDVGAARAAAVQMRVGYMIAFPAALVSNHTRRDAIDMTIRWTGTLKISDAHGKEHLIGAPCDGSNPQLHTVGATFGVLKLVSDAPHWSRDGH